jgi:uncharacterized membrane protein
MVTSTARMARSAFTAALVGLVALVMAAACSDPAPAPASCPSDLPAACPADVPSYARDVAPILSARCLECHVAGGPGAKHDLSTYEHVYTQRSAVLNQVYGCAMPPAEGTALAASERATLLAWLVCHAPNN